MNEVRLVMKTGQVSLATMVENSAMAGFALAGSPTLIYNEPAQLMIQMDVEAAAPEYRIVEKNGQDSLEKMVQDHLDSGWQIYGSMIAGNTPMQAMVRGDIAVHGMYGMGSGEGGDSKDWQPAIDSAMSKAVDTANEHTDKVVGELDSKTSEGFVLQAKKNQMVDERVKALDNQGEQTQIYVDNALQSFHESVTAEIGFLKDDNKKLGLRIEELERQLNMEAEERRTDIRRLEAMIEGKPFIAPVAAAEYPPVIPEGSVWK